MINVNGVIDWVGGLLRSLSELLLALVSFGILTQIALGDTLFGADIVGNLTGIISAIGGENGLVGLIALLIIVGIFRK
jgi:hypothetical protein